METRGYLNSAVDADLIRTRIAAFSIPLLALLISY